MNSNLPLFLLADFDGSVVGIPCTPKQNKVTSNASFTVNFMLLTLNKQISTGILFRPFAISFFLSCPRVLVHTLHKFRHSHEWHLKKRANVSDVFSKLVSVETESTIEPPAGDWNRAQAAHKFPTASPHDYSSDELLRKQLFRPMWVHNNVFTVRRPELIWRGYSLSTDVLAADKRLCHFDANAARRRGAWRCFSVL